MKLAPSWSDQASFLRLMVICQFCNSSIYSAMLLVNGR
ncbi:putative membrane protein [Brucella pseudogrignonensis]|uniref:Putative membrane protein n=1 Tax=Brucella pseudogrignonensis TaxID=419475 RepID=A0A256G850_9HYPH|nr:putative membrane protein [Brucella pseudogrignonensis]